MASEAANETVRAHCPSCVEPLLEDGANRVCSRCRGRYEIIAGVLDLRLHPGEAPAPDPLDAGALERSLASLDRGQPWKEALEALLLDLASEDADALMLAIKESRGAWLPMLRGEPGTALFVGNALSGTSVALAQAGWRVTVLEQNLERLRLARHRARDSHPERFTAVAAGDAPSAPFADRAFDLVVLEQDLPWRARDARLDFEELDRVCARELVLVADNRLGYKRSAGVRGHFFVPGPVAFLRGVARPGERRTLRGYRALFERFERTRAFALYPHAREFSHVVALDRKLPRLTLGPKERRNRLKLAGHSFGLFPVLAPSFAVFGERGVAAPTRIERVLAELAERLGEPLPRAEILVATRSETALVHTAPDAKGGKGGMEGRGDPGGPGAADAPQGRWTLHFPLAPQKRRLLAKHHAFLHRLRRDFPAVRVPEPLFEGELDGLWLTCERRLPGLTAPHYSGDRRVTARMFAQAAEDFSTLLVAPPRAFTRERFDELVAPRFEIVARHAAVASTERALARLRDEARERLVGRVFPLALYHGDLRGKHVQVDSDGSVLGYLDWGAGEDVFLPYLDLLHLVAHQRKQEEDCLPARTWQLLQERDGLREHERAALDAYAERVRLDAGFCAALERIYPVLVAAMAELNWAYSRPRWIHREFGV